MQAQTRRTDVLPLTWEPPATLALAWLLGVVLALPAGQGLAHLVTGEPFTWPSGHLPASVQGLASGDPGIGVPSMQGLPPGQIIYACIGVVELVWNLLVLWVGLTWWRSHGPGAQVGLASRHEVRAVLGPGHLRRRRATIRPDLDRRPRSLGRGAASRGAP